MKLTIEIDCDNDAFQAIDADFGNELKHIITYALWDLVHDVEENGHDVLVHMPLIDSNGNNVGELTYQ